MDQMYRAVHVLLSRAHFVGGQPIGTMEQVHGQRIFGQYVCLPFLAFHLDMMFPKSHEQGIAVDSQCVERNSVRLKKG